MYVYTFRSKEVDDYLCENRRDLAESGMRSLA
jgi:hypothetical protein